MEIFRGGRGGGILRLGKGKEEWGAEKGKVYYIIEILEKEKFDKEISMKQ